MEARDIIPIVIGGLILLGLSRARAPEEAVPPPPPEEEKPPIPQPPPWLPIFTPPEEPEIPYPIEFLLPPPPRREVMPMAVAPPEKILSPPPEAPPVIEVLPVPPEAIQLPQVPQISVRLVSETDFTKTYEIILGDGDTVLDVYPLGAENTVVSMYNIYTGELKLRSFRAPPGYVVTSWSSSGNWDTGDYRAFIMVGAGLYRVPWVYSPRPPLYLRDYAVATGI